VRRLAIKKSSYTTVSLSSGSGTTSALGARASPSAKYPFSTISLIQPRVMVHAPKFYVREFSSFETHSPSELSIPPGLERRFSSSEVVGTSSAPIVRTTSVVLSTLSWFFTSATSAAATSLRGLQRTMTFDKQTESSRVKHRGLENESELH
jgi:hypothetical protein